MQSPATIYNFCANVLISFDIQLWFTIFVRVQPHSSRFGPMSSIFVLPVAQNNVFKSPVWTHNTFRGLETNNFSAVIRSVLRIPSCCIRSSNFINLCNRTQTLLLCKIQRDALFLKFILIKNSTCFGQVYCQSSGVLTFYTQQLVSVMLVMLTIC
jgi:hypothetical protein